MRVFGHDCSEMTEEVLELFRVLHGVADHYSLQPLGAHVISMTSSVTDVLTVLWLWNRRSMVLRSNCMKDVYP